MAGIADQQRPIPVPAAHRLAVEQCPAQRALDPREQRRECAPTGEIRAQPVGIARQVPALLAPVGLLGHRDQIHQIGPDAIGHRMAARPEPGPHAGGRCGGVGGIDPHQRAPGDMAGKARGFRPEQMRAHRRADAVRADQQVGGQRLARCGGDRDVIGAVVDSGQFRAQLQRTGLCAFERLGQDCHQIGAVQRHIGRAPAPLCRFAQRNLQDLARAAAIAQRDRRRALSRRGHRLADAQRIQHAHRIGAELQACAHLFERGGLFDDAHVMPLARQRQRGGQPGNASTGDQDAHGLDRWQGICPFNAPSPSCNRRSFARAHPPLCQHYAALAAHHR